MSDSVYRKTALPVKLNLQDRNTREQLRSGPDEKVSNRGSLEGVKPVAGGPLSSAAQSQKGCTDVMRKDLCDWLSAQGVEGAPPSAEAEQRAMWKWIRDFHKEYSDDWFSRNMPRLHEQFRPVFVQEMKKRRATPAAAPPAQAQAPDLLDLGGPAPAAAPAPAAPAGGHDLLSLDAPAAPAPAAVAPAAAAPAAAAVDVLLDLGLAGSSAGAAAAAAPPAPLPGGSLLDLGGLEAAAAPQAAPQLRAPTAAAGGGLLDLDLAGLDAAFGAPAPAAALPQTAPAAQAAPAGGQGGGLLDLF